MDKTTTPPPSTEEARARFWAKAGGPRDGIAEGIARQAPDIPAELLRQLGQDIVEECRNVLMLHFRFLDVALWHMPLVTDTEMYCFVTDGVSLRFGPMAAAVQFRKNPDSVVRDLLHVILHCIFRHPFEEKVQNGQIYSVACDIAVEALALEMCGKQMAEPEDARRKAVIEQLRKSCSSLSAAKLYRFLYDNVEDEALEQLAGLFARDSHILWACMRLKVKNGPGKSKRRPPEQSGPEAKPLTAETPDQTDDEGAGGEATSSDAPAEETPPEQPAADEGANAADVGDQSETDESDEEDRLPDPEETKPDDEAAREAWERIAKQVQVELQARLTTWGNQSGSLEQALSVANRQRYDYADFLARFATLGEEVQVNDDEFDYVYYTFGLERYGNMPLVEPLEYKETNRVREFVIAIDTSGSCSGQLVRTFVQRTFDILKSTESFGQEVNIHIVQCDAEVKHVAKVKTLRDLDDYLREFRVRGFGGTDFRPVFDYVDQMLDEGEFENLRGVVYFTDGMGTYPAKRPDYDTAFVFVNDNLADVRVPPWAMKVILDEEGVKNL